MVSGALHSTAATVRPALQIIKTRPLFDHLRVYLAEKEQWLDIHAHQNHEHFHFVQDCQLDGKEKQTISHQELLNAQTLDFTLSWLPNHQ